MEIHGIDFAICGISSYDTSEINEIKGIGMILTTGVTTDV